MTAKFNRHFWLLVLLLTVVGLLLCYRLDYRSLWGSEGRWAEIAREMIATGDYFVPTINGAAYAVQKPLLSYWMICLSAKVSGEISEWDARLPTAIFGFFSVFFLYLMGRKLFNPRIGLLAAAIMGSGFLFVFWSKTANSDIPTLALFLLTLYLFLCCEQKQNKTWLFLFYALMAISSNIKGLLGFALPAVVLIPYSWRTRRWDWLLNKTTLPALGLSFFLYFIPALLSSLQGGSLTPLWNILKENFLRYTAAVDHTDPFYIYFILIFPLFAPWSFFLPKALIHSWSSRKNEKVFFALSLFLNVFLFFLLSESRRSYYLLPTLPGASLLVAILFQDWALAQRKQNRFLLISMALFSFLIFTLGISLLFFDVALTKLPPLKWNELFGFILVVLSPLIFILTLKQKKILALSLTFACIYFINIITWAKGFPYLEKFRGNKKFLQEVKTLIEAPHVQQPTLYLYGLKGADTFYLEKKVPEIHSQEELIRLFNSKEESWFLVSERKIKTAESQFKREKKILAEQPFIEEAYSFMELGARYQLLSNQTETE